MTFLPVIAREMSVLSRRKGTYRARSVTAVFALLVMLWLVVVGSSVLSPANMGTSVFLILSALCFGFALLIGMHATADSLSEEKREGTLGLLFLTDLKGFDIVAGKLAATSLNAAYALLGVVPLLALAIFLGGVKPSQIFWVSVVIGNTMFLSLALGMYVSSRSLNERKAMFACAVGLFFITLGPFVLDVLMNGLDRWTEDFYWPSPLYAFLCLHPGAGLDPFYFRYSLGFQHLLAWALLAGASVILPKCVNDLPAKHSSRLKKFFEELAYGKAAARRRHRAAMLDQNAFLWLASREHTKPRYAWLVVGVFAAIYAWVVLQFSEIASDLALAVALLFLLHFIFKAWTASEVCSRLIEDRRSGALELLLSSPLSVREIARGQHLALRRIFLKPVFAVVLGQAALFYVSATAPRQNPGLNEQFWLHVALLSTFLLDLWALKWVGLWLSLTGRSIERVLIAVLGRLLALPWILFGLGLGLYAAVFWNSGRDLAFSETLSLWWAFGFFIPAIFGIAARRRFLREFRDLAARRFDTAPAPREKRKGAPAAKSDPRPRLPEFIREHPAWSLTAAVILLLTAAIGGRRYYWERQVAHALERARQAGDPVTGQERAKFHPPITPAENGFAAFDGVLALKWSVIQSNTRQIWKIQQGLTSLQKPIPSRADRDSLVSMNPEVLAAFRKLPKFERAYVALDITQPWAFPQKHAEALATALAAAHNDREDGRSESCAQNLAAALAFARLMRQQPYYNTQSLCQGALQGVAKVIELLPRGAEWPEDSWRSLQAELVKVDDPASLRKTVGTLRAVFLETWDKPHPGFWTPAPAVLSAGKSVMEGVGSRAKILAGCLAQFERGVEIAERPPASRHLDHARIDAGTFGQMERIAAGLGAYHGSTLDAVVQLDAQITARIALLQTAVALKRHQLRHGAYPSKLEALVPDFLPSLPVDPWSGQLVQFRLGAASEGGSDPFWLLSCVGPNWNTSTPPLTVSQEWVLKLR